ITETAAPGSNPPQVFDQCANPARSCVMSNTARQHSTQASSASPTSNEIAVVDAKTRYQFMMAASEAGLAEQPYRVVTRLALHFKNDTRRCDPGYRMLMHKLG